MPSVSSCFLHVFCFIENPYQTKSKRDKNLRRIILEYMWFLGLGINANGGRKWPRDTKVRPRLRARGGGLCSPRTSVGALLRAQRSLYLGENYVKISAQSELRISGNIRNGFRPDLGNAKQKGTERDIQSRRGSCPSTTMEAMDQRGTLLPSRGEDKEEEEEEGGGGLSPSLQVALERRRG